MKNISLLAAACTVTGTAAADNTNEERKQMYMLPALDHSSKSSKSSGWISSGKSSKSSGWISSGKSKSSKGSSSSEDPDFVWVWVPDHIWYGGWGGWSDDDSSTSGQSGKGSSGKSGKGSDGGGSSGNSGKGSYTYSDYGGDDSILSGDEDGWIGSSNANWFGDDSFGSETGTGKSGKGSSSWASSGKAGKGSSGKSGKSISGGSTSNDGHGYLANSHGGYRGTTYYEADFGEYGSFLMSVDSNGEARFDVVLRNLDWTTVGELSWHLHSGKVGPGARDASGGSAVACGADYTAGHYDPMLRCGSASTAKACSEAGPGEPCCEEKPAADYCVNANIDMCEVGDLSGLYGKILINDSFGQKTVDGPCPDCAAQYDPTASATDGSAGFNTWNSIVFHGSEEDSSARVLCADITRI